MPKANQISVSSGNIKMGRIPSISLPAIITCRKDCLCRNKCYAAKLEKIRPPVKAAYLHNLKMLREQPEVFWRQAEAVIMLSKYFRFHVSGDIPNREYFEKMVAISARQSHCEILCFTKKFSIVNQFIVDGGVIPNNLHLIFSGWKGLSMENPFHFPEAHVLYKDGTTTAQPDAKMCGGNCTECAKTGEGCWTLRNGEQIVFKEH